MNKQKLQYIELIGRRIAELRRERGLSPYKYLYRDKIIRDSIFKCDTIRVPFTVEVVKQVKAPLTSLRNFQVWCGRILLAIALLVGLYFD
ncbi:MAG: hypothetical protein LBD45_07590 [Bacteroidales bacterium]|jgi:hypothetical protein|nr:hypothetical protein [Bacteroidales bacterium]